MEKQQISIFWFRRDLRLEDNAALLMALKSGLPVLPIFIFDRNILEKLPSKKDARVLFIHQEISRLKNELEKIGSSLKIIHQTPKQAFAQLVNEYQIKSVFFNRDYEPYAQSRDQEIHQFLTKQKIAFCGAKDHVIFEKNDIVKDDKKPYVIFTPYATKWKKTLCEPDFYPYPNEDYQKNFLKCAPFKAPTLAEIGFTNFDFKFFPDRKIDEKIIIDYEKNRDFPAINKTTRLSLHIRFGTISIRKLCKIAIDSASNKWLNEIIWRDFYQMIIYHFPYCAKNSFKPQYDKIIWRKSEDDFKKWCDGKTGYPIVDAGMRQLNETGFMHNRARMITASFLTKHLLIDWRLGEEYFAKKLLDYDLASNVGGWQWAAGSGCDAAPYFRIFNPTLQEKRFDPKQEYIKKWVAEFGSDKYPKPIVDHKMARERCLKVFLEGLQAK